VVVVDVDVVVVGSAVVVDPSAVVVTSAVVVDDVPRGRQSHGSAVVEVVLVGSVDVDVTSIVVVTSAVVVGSPVVDVDSTDVVASGTEQLLDTLFQIPR
jgi:hypothetical protein